jgi:pimeloyl-ACP methyl ester carboxylesterase
MARLLALSWSIEHIFNYSKHFIMKQTIIKNKRWFIPKLISTIAAALMITAATLSPVKVNAQVKNIVLVHGAFADGSGFQNLYMILKAKGYNVSVVGNPDLGIPEDVAATQRVIDRQDGPCILVGHSYGGAIITVAGNSPKVAGLVYISAFAPDKGETLIGLLQSYPTDPLSGILPPDKNGFVWYDRAKYHSGFCADIPKPMADFMADSQLPTAVVAFTYVFNDIAWKTKPTWYIVASQDHSIPPDLERKMGKRTGGKVSEINGSHLIFISHPEEVAKIVEAAAQGSAVK